MAEGERSVASHKSELTHRQEGDHVVQPSCYSQDLYCESSILSASVGGDEWRRCIRQPIIIPDLSHTGIRSNFDEYSNNNPPIIARDGVLSTSFKQHIHKNIRALPPLHKYADEQDIKRKDRAKICSRVSASIVPFHIGGRTWRESKALAASRQAQSAPQYLAGEGIAEGRSIYSADGSSIGPEDSMYDQRNKWTAARKARLKRPYSTDSLFQSLLEVNLEPSKPLQWEVKGAKTYLTT